MAVNIRSTPTLIPLLFVLREEIGLTGTKYGCGACTVVIGGSPRRSCQVPVKVVWTRLDRKDLSSSGAGETLLVGLAPALGNVIFDATGARLTSLPLAPRSFKSSGAVVSGMISP
jgi:hypothetical protein